MGNPKIFMVVAALVGGLTYDSTAHAYLDPGTGSILLQGLVAIFAGAAVTIKLYWERLKFFFSRGKTLSKENSEDNSLHDKEEDGS